MTNNKTQIAPSIDIDLSQEYKNFIQHKEGRYRGEFTPKVEQALKLHMAVYFDQNPGERSEFLRDNPNLEDYEDELEESMEIDFSNKPYMSAIKACQEGDFDSAWDYVSEVDPADEGHRALVDAVRFHEDLYDEGGNQFPFL